MTWLLFYDLIIVFKLCIPAEHTETFLDKEIKLVFDIPVNIPFYCYHYYCYQNKEGPS